MTYDWYIEGQPARFTVDMSYEGRPPDPERPVLIYVNAVPKNPGQEQLKPSQRWVLSRLTDRLERKLGLTFVGDIELGEQRQMYFYASNPDVLEDVEYAARRCSGVVATAECVNEPGWETYWQLLFPDAAKYQTVLNRERVARLEKLGDDPKAPRRVNLYFGFPTEPNRIHFAEEARQMGYAVGSPQFEPAWELAYGVALHRISDLTPRSIDEVTVRAIRLAERFSGELRDWDCQLVPKGKVFR